jgi:hypothetical protein
MSTLRLSFDVCPHSTGMESVTSFCPYLGGPVKKRKCGIHILSASDRVRLRHIKKRKKKKNKKRSERLLYVCTPYYSGQQGIPKD